MTSDFVARTIRTYSIVLLILFPFGLYYIGPWRAIAFLSGAVWGIVNLLFLGALIRATVRPDGVQLERAVVYGLIKVPVLYGAGFALLRVPQFEPAVLLAGFTGLFAVMVLKAVARVLLGLDDKKIENNRTQSTL
uniref:ATP synthase subunit I n=1 Tax=uncultured bacterium pAW1 TaxID=1781155 RepID=A0A1C9U4R3_9BACT|nr:hypothetical protein [uncultured bacterium pAW1]